jgi:hypothetical protein
MLEPTSGGTVWIGPGKDLHGNVTVVPNLIQRNDDPFEIEVTRAGILPVIVSKVDEPTPFRRLPEALIDVVIFDVHVIHVEHQSEVVSLDPFDHFDAFLSRPDVASLVAVDGLQDESHALWTSIVGYLSEYLLHLFQRPRAIRSVSRASKPTDIHNRTTAKAAAGKVNELLAALKGCSAHVFVGLNQTQSVLAIHMSGAQPRNGKTTPIRQSSYRLTIKLTGILHHQFNAGVPQRSNFVETLLQITLIRG